MHDPVAWPKEENCEIANQVLQSNYQYEHGLGCINHISLKAGIVSRSHSLSVTSRLIMCKELVVMDLLR